MKISHAKGYRGFWIVGLDLNGADWITGEKGIAGRRLQCPAQRSAMGGSENLVGDAGTGDSGHPRPNRGHENDECINASPIRQKGRAGKHIRTMAPWWCHGWRD